MRHRLVAVGIGLILGNLFPAVGQSIHRQTFESENTSLRLGLTDAQVRLLEHGMATDQRHSGNQSERMVVRIVSGSYCPVEYATPKSYIVEELVISAWVHVSRPGTKLLARVVLPNVTDLATGKPAVTLINGDEYDVSNRWRRLEIRRPDLLLEKQRQLLQAQRGGQKVDISNAYVEAIVFDIHSGIGDVTLLVDDIQMNPVVRVANPAESVDEQTVPLPLRGEDGQKIHAHMPKVRDAQQKNQARVVADRLELGDQSFFLRGIRQKKAPLNILKEAGFNTVFSTWPVPEEVKTVAGTQMQIVPMLGQTSVQNASAASPPMGLAIYLGDGLDLSSIPKARADVASIRAVDSYRNRPITAEVTEAYARYSDVLDMIGASRAPLGTTMNLGAYRRWLRTRRNLARPGTLFWTWIQTEMPEEYCNLVYGHGYGARFAAPVGPQPDQIRLLTYNSLAAGYRGIAFDSDASLAESSQGRARLLQLALLNLELQLIEPFLADGRQPTFAKTSHPNVMAVVYQHKHGVLCIPIWTDSTSQYVVGQSSVNDLQVSLGAAAESAQAYQISLGEVRALEREADIAGFRVTIPEFDTIAFILMTTDTTLISRYQELIQLVGPDAAAWYSELAELELAKTEEINARLEASGHPYKEAPRLLVEARTKLEECRENLRSNRHRLAVLDAGRSLRIARTLQQGRWLQAVEKLPNPTANPYALSFYTLPEFYEFQAGVAQAAFGENLVPSGDFERNGNLGEVGWSYRAHSSQNFATSAYLVGGNPREGKRSLQLRVASEEPVAVAENTVVEMVSPAVRVEPGQVVRVSGFVRLPRGAQGSEDGAKIWDSLGGRALALQFTQPSDWTHFVFYRPVNRSGECRVHIEMTGLGDALFDDLRVEVADNANVPIAGQDRPVLLR